MGSSSARRVRVEPGIYRQPNGKYAVCWRHAGRLRFRGVGFDLAAARRERLALFAATREGSVPLSPRLRFETVASRWLDRFEAKVATGERHPRTLEAHRYQLDRHLLPALGQRAIASLAVDDVAELLHELRRTRPLGEDLGERARDAAGRDALRAPLRLDHRRPRRAARARRTPAAAAPPPARARPRRDRAPARGLLAPRPAHDRDRPLHRPAHLRDARPGLGRRRLRGRPDPRPRAALARPPRRARPTRRAEDPALGPRRPLVPSLHAGSAHTASAPRSRAARTGCSRPRAAPPYSHRNVSRRVVGRAAQRAGLNDDGWPPLRFHDLRHTFASHLIVDLGLDPAQVSRILGHARITITLDIYTHLFEDARHARDIRTRMAASPFAGLLEPAPPADGATVLKLR
jgi:Phage integrase family